MNSAQNNTGTIVLKRRERDFHASFCLIRAELPALIESLPLLHAIEKEYYEELKHDQRKISYLLGRIAARTAISNLAETKIEDSFYIDFGIFQFPVVKGIANHNIQTTITHCDDIGIAIAFPEEHPIGLDIEHINGQRINTMKSQVSAAETALLLAHNIPLPIGYTLVWTVKEALSKILRTGLTMDLKMAEIKTLEKTEQIYTSTFLYFEQYKAISYHSGNYVCTVILPRRTSAQLEEFWTCFANAVSG